MSTLSIDCRLCSCMKGPVSEREGRGRVRGLWGGPFVFIQKHCDVYTVAVDLTLVLQKERPKGNPMDGCALAPTIFQVKSQLLCLAFLISRVPPTPGSICSLRAHILHVSQEPSYHLKLSLLPFSPHSANSYSYLKALPKCPL